MEDTPKTPKEAVQQLEAIKAYIAEQAELMADLRKQSEIRPFSEVGKKVQEARRRQGLTIDDLSLYSNVSKVTIGKIEKGDTSVTVPKLQAVLSALGINLWVG